MEGGTPDGAPLRDIEDASPGGSRTGDGAAGDVDVTRFPGLIQERMAQV